MVVTAMWTCMTIGMFWQDMITIHYDFAVRLAVGVLMGILSYMLKTATHDKAERVQFLVVRELMHSC